jgi:hypothetical protein
VAWEAYVPEVPEIQFDLRSIAPGAQGEVESAPRLEDDGLPEIRFDLSFLDQREPVDVEQAEVGDPDMRNDTQRQERDLQEGFRQRTAELARRSSEREDGGPNRPERLRVHQPG